jgi:hypothetical protein
MPNQKIQTVYISTGDPDTMNSSELYKPGELGAIFDFAGSRRYQLVQLDSGATAAPTVGVVAATQVAFWKDRSKYLVTNDLRFSNRNEVAGIFRAAVTAGYYCCVLKKGNSINVKADSATYADGDVLIANSGTNAAAINIAAGTAPTYIPIGVARAVSGSGVVPADVNIPEIV